MRNASRWLAAGVVGIWACGGNNTTTPPPGSTVASVTVTPPTAAMNVAATLQLTATVRDTAGAVVTPAVTWTTSAPTVATVSGSGLVTAVGAGSVAITATAEGKSGQSIITVVSNQYGPVLSTVQIGSSGGTVGTSDFSVTIPSGALSSTSTIKLIQDTVSHVTFPGNDASSMYYIDGLPAGVTVSMRVRIKYTGTNSGTAAIALLRPSLEENDTVTYVLGPTMYPAIDSSGYLVATIPVTGRTNWSGGAPGTSLGAGAHLFEPSLLNADAGLMALLNLSHSASTAAHFDLWGIGGTQAELNPKLTKVGTLAEQAYTTLHETMGYNFAFRTWPVQVYVKTLPKGNGVFSLPGPFPKNLDLSYISYEKSLTDNANFPGTVIHELFHLVKSNLLDISTEANWVAKNWLDEATSTWVAEKHPALTAGYLNPTAESWRDSLYAGLSDVMVANSGYGKAPMIKYIAKQWGDAKVKDILNLVHGGMTPTSGFLQGVGQDPKLWWPLALTEQVGGSLYAWPLAELMPKQLKAIPLMLGRDPSWETDAMYTLGVEGVLLSRDTALFGPNFTLPIYLDPADIGSAKIVAFQKSAASANFRALASGDTVNIPGYLLQRKDSILLYFTNVKPVAPYSAKAKIHYYTDLSLPQGDWYFPAVTNLNNATHFVCDRPGSTVKMDMDTNAIEVWGFLSRAGTWKKTNVGNTASVTHTWVASPGGADTLAMLGLTMTSTMVTGTNGDTIHAQANLRWNFGAGPGGTSLPAPAPRGASLWWLLIPAGALPLAFRRRSRVLGVAITGLSLLVLASCIDGQIALNIDETFDYTFSKMRFTADPATPSAPLMQVYNGTGKTTLNSYTTSYWSYSYDGFGAKTDSVKVTCTGSGSATYTVDGAVYTDGAVVPAALRIPDAIARMLNRDPGLASKYLKLTKP